MGRHGIGTEIHPNCKHACMVGKMIVKEGKFLVSGICNDLLTLSFVYNIIAYENNFKNHRRSVDHYVLASIDNVSHKQFELLCVLISGKIIFVITNDVKMVRAHCTRQTSQRIYRTMTKT